MMSSADLIGPVKKRITLAALTTWCLGGCATHYIQQDRPTDAGRFVGAWELVSWTSTTDERTSFPFGGDAKGLLIYSTDGRMSVFLSQANRTPFARAEAKAGTPDEKAAAFDSCFAYTGTFEVAEGRVIHRLQHRTFPNWIGTEQVRFVWFNGGRLILETPPLPTADGLAVSRLVWERLKPSCHQKGDF